MKQFRRIVFNLICLCLLFCVTEPIPAASAASTMAASEACIDFIKGVEGFSSQPYYDYNQYTVGYGTKCPTENYFEYKANGISRSEADALLREFVAGIEEDLNKKFIDRYNLSLNQHQFDALVTFSYNIGTSWVTYDSTLRNTILRNGDENDMVYAFSLYCTAGGQYLPGLVSRRLCEVNIYLNGVYDRRVSDAYGYVYYDANGGTLNYRVQGFVCDNNTVPAASAQRSGHEFVGWFTNITGGTQVGTLNGSLSGRTLFARWQSAESADSPSTNSIAVKVTGDVLNVRSGPGTNYSIVRKAYQNEALTVTHVSHITSMKWGNIQDGWICLDYTNYDAVINGTDEPEAEENTGSSDTPENEDSAPAAPENPILVSGIVQVNDALRIRSGPGTNHSVVGFLFNGKEVDILELETVGDMVWGRISKGWVSMDYVVTDTIQGDDPILQEPVPEQQPTEAPTEPEAPTVEEPEEPEQIPEQTEPEPEAPPQQDPTESVGSVESVSVKGIIKADALRIRSGAGTDNRIVGFYYQNNTVVITEKVLVDSVYWGKTDKGWINMDYVVPDSAYEESAQPAEGTRMTVIGDCLRVRKGTGTNYRISQLLYYGDTVIVYETVTVDGTVWGRVHNGWVCMDYVS